MPPDSIERKLTALLCADAVGYSRLMAEDEAETIRLLTTYRRMIADLVCEHRGRVVDNPGDNVLAEFPTALDAVEAAVEINELVQKEVQRILNSGGLDAAIEQGIQNYIVKQRQAQKQAQNRQQRDKIKNLRPVDVNLDRRGDSVRR